MVWRVPPPRPGPIPLKGSDMGNSISRAGGNQGGVTGDWKNWTKEQVAVLPFEVQRCQSFRAGLKKRPPHIGNYRRSCRRDVCPACGRMWASEFITQHAIRFGIPDNQPYSLVINFPPLNIAQSPQLSTASAQSFTKQRLLVELLRDELVAQFGRSGTIAGWFGIPHFVRIPGGKVRHHLHLTFIGAISGLTQFVQWVKQWTKERHLTAVTDKTVRGIRSLRKYADYFRHEPVETGSDEGHFGPQGLSQVHDALEMPWRATGGKRSMFERFIDGPAWSAKGLRRLRSRVVKERVASARAATVGVGNKLRLSHPYCADDKRPPFATLSIPKVRWVERCPLRYSKSKKKSKKCKGISFPSTSLSAMICRCEKCKKSWLPQSVFGRKRNRKAKQPKL